MKTKGCIEYPDFDRAATDFIKDLPCHAKGHYPSTKIEKKNKHDAELLLNAFADGAAAELTAITQYINHHLQLMHLGERGLANLLLCISLVEMMHLDMIGTMIRELGLDPKYYRSNKSYWTGGNVDYGKTVCEILLEDIGGEKAAITAYTSIIKLAEVERVRKVVRRIREDEEYHLHLLETAYKRCCHERHDHHHDYDDDDCGCMDTEFDDLSFEKTRKRHRK